MHYQHKGFTFQEVENLEEEVSCTCGQSFKSRRLALIHIAETEHRLYMKDELYLFTFTKMPPTVEGMFRKIAGNEWRKRYGVFGKKAYFVGNLDDSIIKALHELGVRLVYRERLKEGKPVSQPVMYVAQVWQRLKETIPEASELASPVNYVPQMLAQGFLKAYSELIALLERNKVWKRYYLFWKGFHPKLRKEMEEYVRNNFATVLQEYEGWPAVLIVKDAVLLTISDFIISKCSENVGRDWLRMRLKVLFRFKYRDLFNRLVDYCSTIIEPKKE